MVLHLGKAASGKYGKITIMPFSGVSSNMVVLERDGVLDVIAMCGDKSACFQLVKSIFSSWENGDERKVVESMYRILKKGGIAKDRDYFKNCAAGEFL